MSDCTCGHHHHTPSTCATAPRQPGEVRLTGHLVCANLGEMMTVLEHVSDHVALTRAEPGCLAFDVVQSDDPLVWQVSERFRDSAAFRAHQARTAESAWGRATRGITRQFEIVGLEPEAAAP